MHSCAALPFCYTHCKFASRREVLLMHCEFAAYIAMLHRVRSTAHTVQFCSYVHHCKANVSAYSGDSWQFCRLVLDPEAFSIVRAQARC